MMWLALICPVEILLSDPEKVSVAGGGDPAGIQRRAVETIDDIDLSDCAATPDYH